ncbi:MAG TPA: hypothetical protein VLD58_17440 [Gemmatimonadales bacterium]|nr:hypothetical protein [Gemmatimonadales bacterium]
MSRMGRVLTAARATVPAEHAAEYLAALRELQACRHRRGEHLWVFRHPREAGVFLEFAESASADTHPLTGAEPPEERSLELRLQALAAYAPDARVLWEEIPLEEP